MNTLHITLKKKFAAAVVASISAVSIGILAYDLYQPHGQLARTFSTVATKHDQPAILSVLNSIGVGFVRDNQHFLLGRAAASGSNQVIDWLVDSGADLHFDSDRALALAAQYGHLSTVEYLIDQGADVNSGGGMALYVSVVNGQEKVVELLLERGAEPRRLATHSRCHSFLSSAPTDIVQKLGPNPCLSSPS